MGGPDQMPVSGMMWARLRVLTSGLRTSYQPWIGIEPSHASLVLWVSRRGSKPMFWQVLKTSRAASLTSTRLSAGGQDFPVPQQKEAPPPLASGEWASGRARHTVRMLVLAA